MSRFEPFGKPQEWPQQDLIAFSRQFDPALALLAYRCGVFPMALPSSGFQEMGWWSPLLRGVLPLDALRVTRSLRKSAHHYVTTVDGAFEQVLDGCADPSRPYGWIDDDIRRVYLSLHEAGHCHSIETWDASGRLVGGLYGISQGGLFAGESMFHDPVNGRDASKVALMALVSLLSDQYAEQRIIDTQWQTPHLASLGVIEIDRSEYLSVVAETLTVPEPIWPSPGEVIHAGASRS